MNDLLSRGFEKLGIVADAEQLKKLDIFLGEIHLFNPVYKLVKAVDDDDLIVRHFLDSAAGVDIIRRCIGDGKTVADLGSGAGFPGIVLAILLPDVHFFLVERMQRRVDFLENVIARCNLSNVTVLPIDTADCKEHFALVTCRAFHPLYDILSEVSGLLDTGGTLCAYKGQRDYLEAEIESLGPEKENWEISIEGMKVPYLDESRLMCVLKKR